MTGFVIYFHKAEVDTGLNVNVALCGMNKTTLFSFWPNIKALTDVLILGTWKSNIPHKDALMLTFSGKPRGNSRDTSREIMFLKWLQA